MLTREVKNLPVGNPNFLRQFKKEVSMLAQKNRIVEEFESENENDEERNEKLVLGVKSDKRP